jgi:hypothetical protein
MKLQFCAVCGSSDNIENLELHHFIPRSQGGSDDETNLLTLCYSCHGSVHGMFRKNIKELTRSGLKKAKAKGKKLGSPNPENGGQIIKERALAFAHIHKITIEKIISSNQTLSLRGIAKELELRKVKTPRGKDIWSPSQVSNLLELLNINTYYK